MLTPNSSAYVDLTITPACPSRSLDTLALRAQRGEPGAVEELITVLLERLRPLVSFRVLTHGRGALNEADIDDMLQDVIFHIWKHDLALFDPRKSGFLTFANRRIQWHLSDSARVARRNRGDDVEEVELEEVVDVDRDPESLLSAHSAELLMVDMERTIKGTGADRQAREVIVRHDLRGATLSAVADELDIHVSNACRARQRGLRHLARHLEALV